MVLAEWLKGISGRVGFVRFVSTTAPAPPRKIPTRSVSLKELVSEVREREGKSSDALPPELSASFDRVYAASGVEPPAHGWTISKLAEFVNADHIRGLARPEAQKTILGALTAANAHVQDVVKDALARDGALDEFQIFIRAKMDARAQARLLRIEALRRQARELEAEVARLEAEGAGDERSWQDWRRKKISAEKEMAAALAYLLDEPVVTVDAESDAK